MRKEKTRFACGLNKLEALAEGKVMEGNIIQFLSSVYKIVANMFWAIYVLNMLKHFLYVNSFISCYIPGKMKGCTGFNNSSIEGLNYLSGVIWLLKGTTRTEALSRSAAGSEGTRSF